MNLRRPGRNNCSPAAPGRSIARDAVVVLTLLAFASPARAGDTGSPSDVINLYQARARGVRAAVAAVAPSIVTIETVGGAQPVRERAGRIIGEERFRVGEGPTTGIVFSADGLIITSSFNFVRDPAVITVRLADGRRFTGRLLGTDNIRRVTLLQIDAEDLPTPEWADPGEVRVGQYAIACGRALGGGDPSASLGMVSAVGRRSGNALQTDARTSPVNYGGPLIDLHGRVLGVIVPMAGAGGGAVAGAEWYDGGIGFAVVRDPLDEVLPRLAAGETIEPGKIGIILGPTEPDLFDWLDELFPQSGGVRIVVVARRSPAADAGLQVDDVIVALDGEPIGDLAELQRRLSDRAAGDRVILTVKRRWQRLNVPIRLAKMADISGFEAPSPQTPGGDGDALPPEQPSTQPTPD